MSTPQEIEIDRLKRALYRIESLARDFPYVPPESHADIFRIIENIAAIFKLKLGVPVWDVPLELTPTGGLWLGFSKVNKAWRLVLTEQGTGAPQIVPLLTATRERRIQAVEHFPRLIIRLVEVAKEELCRVQNAIAVCE